MQPERSEGAERSGASMDEAQETREKIAAGGCPSFLLRPDGVSYPRLSCGRWVL